MRSERVRRRPRASQRTAFPLAWQNRTRTSRSLDAHLPDASNCPATHGTHFQAQKAVRTLTPAELGSQSKGCYPLALVYKHSLPLSDISVASISLLASGCVSARCVREVLQCAAFCIAGYTVVAAAGADQAVLWSIESRPIQSHPAPEGHDGRAAGAISCRASIGYAERGRAAGGGVLCRLSPGIDLNTIEITGVAAGLGRGTRIDARASASARGVTIVRSTATAKNESRDRCRVPIVLCHKLNHSQ